MHVAERDVEAAMQEALGDGPFRFLVDLGTGTGRTLELFADRFARGLGLDVNQAMLAYARAKLTTKGCANAQVRHGDMYALSLADRQADAIVMHQVLHFLSDPALAIREAARVLAPGGKLLIVDFAPHDLEFLRTREAHERLGFTHDQITGWLKDAGLVPKTVRDLAPTSGGQGEILTVTIWLAERPENVAENVAENSQAKTARSAVPTDALQEAR
jgi:ArsR family transcriptional regulator